MRLFHAVNVYTSNNAEERIRNNRAMETWQSLYMRHSGLFVPAYLEKILRSSLDIGDSRNLPYIKDVIDKGFEDSKDKDDIVVFTNMDSCLVTETIENLCLWYHDPKRQTAWSNRRELDKAPKIQFNQEDLIVRSEKSEGVDLISMRRSWWESVRGEFPDLFLGCEGFDWVFRFLMGRENRIREVVYHVQHGMPAWFQQRRTSPANLHNRKLCLAWVNKRTDKDMIKRSWPGIQEYEKDLKRVQ